MENSFYLVVNCFQDFLRLHGGQRQFNDVQKNFPSPTAKVTPSHKDPFGHFVRRFDDRGRLIQWGFAPTLSSYWVRGHQSTTDQTS